MGLFFILLRPICFPRTTLLLPPSNNSDPGLPSSPLPTAVRAFFFVARIFWRFLPSLTCVDLCSEGVKRQYVVAHDLQITRK